MARDPEPVRLHLAQHHPDPALRPPFAAAKSIAIPWADYAEAIKDLARRFKEMGIRPAKFVQHLQKERVGPPPPMPAWIGFPDGTPSPEGKELLGYLVADEGTWLLILHHTPEGNAVQTFPLHDGDDEFAAVNGAYPRMLTYRGWFMGGGAQGDG